MAEADIEKYCDVMEEVKRRTSVIDFFLSGQGNAIYVPTTVETCCLQLRKILELIAFASLVANKEAYSSVYADFAKYWNAGQLLKLLAKVNPCFYPQPVIEVPSKQLGIKHELKKREPDYLSEKEFTELYGRCGVIMHAANPYGTHIDYDFYKKTLPVWRSRIINLLNNHEIRLVGNPGLYLIHMKEDGTDKVRGYTFAPAKPI
jgi:hypothetical protein